MEKSTRREEGVHEVRKMGKVQRPGEKNKKALLITALLLVLFFTVMVLTLNSRTKREKALLTDFITEEDKILVEKNKTDFKPVFERYTESEENKNETQNGSEVRTEKVQEKSESNAEEVRQADEGQGVPETSPGCAGLCGPKYGTRYGVNGAYLREDIYDYLLQKMTDAGILEYMYVALCQAYQESCFDLNAEAPHITPAYAGHDCGLFQYFDRYWPEKATAAGLPADANIYSPYNQIDVYVYELKVRLPQGVFKAISDHYTGGYESCGFSAEYVYQVTQWFSMYE